MIVLRVVYRTMFTPRALFSVCFTEQCLLLELCSHDCSLCGLQNNAYYWSFGLMIVLWFTEQWLLLGLHSFCGLLHQPPPVHTTRLVACLPLSSFPAVFYCFSLSFVVFPLSFVVCSINWILPSDCYSNIKGTEKLTGGQTWDRKRTDIYVVMLLNK